MRALFLLCLILCGPLLGCAPPSAAERDLTANARDVAAPPLVPLDQLEGSANALAGLAGAGQGGAGLAGAALAERAAALRRAVADL